ncbi:MAG: hypothetical protein OXJ62_10790 [Spirochaetaceae bacterium]|nr:hypothetical protein [Spirochaetaceae bacterium]
MSIYERDHDEGRDPFAVWGQALLREPDDALDRILSGAGGRGSQRRAEPDDFLSDLLANPAHQGNLARLTKGLDKALLRWIEARSGWSPTRIVEFGPRAYAAQMADALAVVARLSLTETAGELIRNHVLWDDRFDALRRPGDIDLLREFDLVLATHQTDMRFVPRWFAACEEAAWSSPSWQTRLTIGLLGLRKLPATIGTEPEMMQATALARFAALGLARGMDSDLVERAFRQRAGAMTTLYPRDVGYWQRLWGEVLAHLCGASDSSVARLSSWLGIPMVSDNGTATHRAKQPQASNGRAELPEYRRREWLEQDIRDTSYVDPHLFDRVRGLIRDHWRYAFASGQSYYAVRTTASLCNLILRSDANEQQVEQIHPWALQAVEAEPGNPFTWDLWAKVLSVLGHVDAALSVRWESIRRFPQNGVLRNSLAYLLAKQDRTTLAEHLLRETMKDFRDDPLCRSILANLLIRAEREGEAERLLEETTREFQRDTVSRHTLAMLLWRQGRQREAESVMRALHAMAPDDVHVGRLAERIRAQRHISAAFAESELNSIYQGAGIRGGLDASAAHGTEARTSWPWRGESRPADEQTGTLGDGSTIAAYLSRLESRTGLLERFFASSEADTGEPSGEVAHHECTSDLALVAAHRAGLLDRANRRKELHTWIEAHPSSYSVRLLLVWRGTSSRGPDSDALRAIEREFPEHREWNEWLSYAFNSRDHGGFPKKMNRDGPDSWASRLVAVYPSATTQQGDAPVRYVPGARRRLMEDIAFANAERAVPSIGANLSTSALP